MKTFTPNAVARAFVPPSSALEAYLGMRMEAPTFDMAAIKAALEKIGDQVKEAGEKALAEAKKSGDMYAADKPKVDEMLVKQGELQARLLEAEQKLAKRTEASDTGPKSAGQLVIEAPEFKAWAAERNMKRSFTMPMPQAAITSIPGSAGQGVMPQVLPGVLTLPRMRLTVRDLITPGQTSSNSLIYIREKTWTDATDMVSEGAKKPESDATFDQVTAGVKKIAAFMKATTEILDDFPMLQSFIDGKLRYLLKLKEEAQLLKGSGVGNNLNGIYTQATAYVAPIVVPAPTKIDVLRLMILQAELALYPANGIVLHPSDWAAIELTKSTQGEYIFANVQSMAVPGLWGRPVVATPAMTVSTALVGAFQLGAQIFDRMQASVVIATENEDDFVKNLVTILVEERLALAVYLPLAFTKNPAF